MKVGIVGSGDVGQALGLGLARRGHDVMIGSRTPDGSRLKGWLEVLVPLWVRVGNGLGTWDHAFKVVRR